VLNRLWQTKRNNVLLFEKWMRDTRETEIAAGLNVQLADERRHLRLIGEEIKRLTGRPAGVDRAAPRPFVEAQAATDDLHRLCIIHGGVKRFVRDRCCLLVSFVDARLARVLEQVARDEDRHVRWADIRVSRLLARDDPRACQQLMERIQHMLEVTWGKDWAEATRAPIAAPRFSA
jgi:hypothetical protein